MMKSIAATLLTLTALTGVAHADDDAKCGNAPQDQWMTEAAMKTKATELGFDVRQIKVEDGCYEVYGIKDGNKVEALFNPQTGVQVGVDGDD